MRGKDKETRAAAIRAMFLRGDVRILHALWNTASARHVVTPPLDMVEEGEDQRRIELLI
jgi:phage terminase large subunit-like protein